MKLPYIKQGYLDRMVRERTGDQLKAYLIQKDAWLNDYYGTAKWRADSTIEVGPPPELTMPDSRNEKKDLENSIKIFVWLKSLSITQASDPRLWTCFAFDLFWDYMMVRWPPATTNIDDRYFLLRKNSRCLIRHGIARLWWFSRLTYDAERQDPFELTAVLLESQDIQASLLERSFGRNQNVLRGTLEFLRTTPQIISGTEELRKKEIQIMGKKINQLGGVTLLDTLSIDEVVKYLKASFL